MNRCCHSVGFWGESSESKALNTPKTLSARHDEVAKAVAGVWCLGWVGYMYIVTALTESLRPSHLNDVAKLVYELGQSPVYHIPSKTVDGKRMDTFLGLVM